MNHELNLLIHLVSGIYREKHFHGIKGRKFNIERLISLASKNNLLLQLSRQISCTPFLSDSERSRFHDIINDGEKKIEKIIKSFKHIEKHIPDGFVIKTFRGNNFHRIPNDIDVLTGKFRNDVAKFLQLGYQTSAYLPREESVCLTRQDTWKIHLQSKVSWACEEFMDKEFILRNPRIEILYGQKLKVPNVTADLLIHIAHMNFEPLHILLSELFYLFSIIPKIDFHAALEQSDKYRWKNTFLRTLALINSLHGRLYDNPLIPAFSIEKDIDDMTFPFCFSRRHLMRAAFEKRLFLYPLTRLFKVLHILIAGDTFSRYISPPDYEEASEPLYAA